MTALEEIKKALKKVYIAEWYISGVKTNGLSVVHNAADSSMFGITAETFEAEYIAAVNPAAISELLSTLESAHAEENRLRAIALDMQAGYREAIARAEAAEAEVKRYRSALIAKEPSDRMLIAGSLVDWKKYSDKKEAARDVWNVMHRNADGPALASREGDTHKPVAYVCAADMELLGKSSDGWDFSMSPKPRPDLGMNMALYAAPLTETSKPDPVLWVSPVDLRAWQKAKAGEIWAWSENLEGECIPLYTALASTGGEHHAE